MNKLICQICDKALNEPKLCPHCSQIFCKICITGYLAEKHFCPTCDNYIIDLVDCGRLVSEFQQVVSAKKTIGYQVLGSRLSQNKQVGNKLKYKICKLHNLKLQYYCNRCKVWICSDCGVIQANHRGHDIINKKQAQSINKQQLQVEFNKINDTLDKLNSKKQRCLLDLQIYRTQLKWSKQKVKKYCDELLQRIDMEGQKQIQQLLQKIRQYENLVQRFKKKQLQIQNTLNYATQNSHNLNHNTGSLKWEYEQNRNKNGILRVQDRKEVSSCCPNQKIMIKSQKIIQKKQKQKLQLHSNSHKGIHPKHNTNSNLSIENNNRQKLRQHKQQKQPQLERSDSSIWLALKQHQNQQQSSLQQESQANNFNIFLNRIKKIQVIEEIFPPFANFTYQFDYQNLKMDNFNYSNYFELWGQDWRLKIYPRGNSVVFGKYLSVFLQLANGHTLEKSKKYVYKIELLSLNKAGSTIAKEYCSIFQSGQSWGYSDYLNLIHLNQYLHEGKLLFSVSIRNQSYEGLCNDLKKYIIKIQNQNKILQKLLCQGPNQQQHNQNSGVSSYYNQNWRSKYRQGRQRQREGQIMQKTSFIQNLNESSINMELNLNLNMHLEQPSEIQMQNSAISS